MHRSRPHYYKLIGKLAVPVADMIEWAKYFEDTFRETGVDARRVAFTEVGPIEVSTVFLGLDHQWSSEPNAPPVLFETMVFGGEPKIIFGREIVPDIEAAPMMRYSTWDEAEKGHALVVEWARNYVARIDAALKTTKAPC